MEALSIARPHAGTQLQSMAAPYSITWPGHYESKWISRLECTAVLITVAQRQQHNVTIGVSKNIFSPKCEVIFKNVLGYILEGYCDNSPS